MAERPSVTRRESGFFSKKHKQGHPVKPRCSSLSWKCPIWVGWCPNPSPSHLCSCFSGFSGSICILTICLLSQDTGLLSLLHSWTNFLFPPKSDLNKSKYSIIWAIFKLTENTKVEVLAFYYHIYLRIFHSRVFTIIISPFSSSGPKLYWSLSSESPQPKTSGWERDWRQKFLTFHMWWLRFTWDNYSGRVSRPRDDHFVRSIPLLRE